MDGCDIMLVEDDALVATFLEAVIGKRFGLKVARFKAFPEAKAALIESLKLRDAQYPRMFLVDWNVAGKQAAEFVHWTRTNTTLNAIPLYVVSADAAPAVRRDAIDAGATAFATKDEAMLKFPDWARKAFGLAA